MGAGKSRLSPSRLRGSENNYPIAPPPGNNMNSLFHYTQDYHRREWVKLIFPYLMSHFFEIVKTIPWDSYRYDGEVYAKEWYEEGRKDMYRPIGLIPVHVEGIVYCVFGGAECEYLNMKYKEDSDIDLRDYVDPTGDFDIKIFYDSIKYDSRSDNVIIQVYNDEGQISPLFDDMTRWVFKKVCEKIEALPLTQLIRENRRSSTIALNNSDQNLFRNLLHISEDDPLFIYGRYGNLIVLRKRENNMIKIQVTAMIRMPNGEETMDHLTEFILMTGEDATGENVDMVNSDINDIFAKEKRKITNIDGLNVEKIDIFFVGQIKGYFDRYAIFTNDSKAYLMYKIQNHVQRLKYILKMAPFLHKKFPSSEYPNIMQGIHYYLTSSLPNQLEEKTGKRNVIRVNKTGNNTHNLEPYEDFVREFLENYARYERRTLGGRRRPKHIRKTKKHRLRKHHTRKNK
jgi:hypothetical protein